MKRFFALMIAILMIASLSALSAAAAPTSDGRLVVDNADLFTDTEEAQIEALELAYGEEMGCDIIVYTTTSLDGYSPSTYADYCHIENYNENSVLLMICIAGAAGDRDFAISTHGDCIKKLNDGEIEEIKEIIIPYLSRGDYYGASQLYIQKSAEYMKPHLKWFMLPLSILIGFAIAIIIMLAIRSKLKTVQMQRGAANYIRPGSMNVRIARDTYLYSTVSRVAKPKSTSGSSTHSTGGSSFGGSSGKF